ncbi:hypothetical protein ACXC9Q_08585 [Kribbella sp. CWNU-51]
MQSDESLPADLAGDLVSSVLPGGGPLLSRLIGAVAGEWSRNQSHAMSAAVRTSGLSREDLVERIEEQPELVPLVTRLLHEAAMTGQGPLLEAMGAAFGAAVVESARAPEYELVLGGLRNLHGVDVRFLREIRDRPVFQQQTEEEEAEALESDRLQTSFRLAVRLQVSEETLWFGLVRLANQGFAVTEGVYSGNRVTITELGRLLYDVLERMNNA